MSFYNIISDLLGENKFDFFPLPSFTNFTNNNRDKDINKTAREMFEPYTGTIVKSSGPQFICMYVGGTSRMVDLRSKGGNCKIDQDDLSFNDDGFEISDDTTSQKPPEYAKPMSEEPLAPSNTRYNYKDPDRIEGNGFTAFRIAYGIENQNMFKNIELDQSEFTETNESLMVIDRLAKGGNPSDRTQKGNNLHNVYLTRAYTCKVESLGNMTIQPLQYFELTNVPMFYGTYLITEVSHNVKPNHITTNFKGTRQPIATVPVVEDVATAMNQSIRDIEASKKKRDVLDGGFGSGSGSDTDCYDPNSSTSTTIPVDVGGVNYNKFSDSEFLNKRNSKFKANKVDTIVLHWTGGNDFDGAVKTLKRKNLSYHFILGEDGKCNQVSDLLKTGSHAGCACGGPKDSNGKRTCKKPYSNKGKTGLNSRSIGISYVGGTGGYVRTVDDWNQDSFKSPKGGTFNAKEQFAAIIKACLVAKKQHPGIKYLTSHHWVTTRKVDVGDNFPWNILLKKLKEADPSFNDLEVKFDWDNDCSGTGGGKVRDNAGIGQVTGNIDLNIQDALEQEQDGNDADVSNNNTTGTAVDGNIVSPKNVNEALKFAGKIK
jgi:N-acetyl-anhydromuramyl-L-alanine amidase AmpD